MTESADGFSFVAAELEVLKFWQEEDIFQKSLRQTADCPPYVFYDGPPFATGLPHHGHFVANTIKDVVPRYWTMQGYHVARRFGWDCHGLPIEHEIDKTLNLSTQEAVDRLGVQGYNDHCRKIVQRYTSAWRQSIERLGRWVDFDNDYKTMDVWFMESVWWVFQQLWQKGLVYKGAKVMPVSTALRTVLSNFEANSNYRQVQDPAITVLFKLADEDAWLAAWTTTPWTLPGNLAICAGADIDYVKVRDKKRGLVLYLAEARLHAYDKTQSLEILGHLKGRDLSGRAYQPLFPYFADYQKQGAFVVLNDTYVTTDDGTGLVHIAPAFGEDDYRVMQAANLKMLPCPVDMSGLMTEQVTDFAGLYVKDANPEIIRHLKDKGALYKQDTIEHNYPFCYRSDTPLIYRIVDSWYIEVSKIKARLIAANQQTNWVPASIKDKRFGNWLQDARDWAVSRNRVWGTPLPIWVNDHTGQAECFGSLAEIKEATGVELEDLHREHVDGIEFTRPGEEGVYRRVPEVLDCWFESGAMPYAQIHYPFANKDVFERGFPAEFIAEGLDQTRGWFYTLMVLSTALYDKPAFKNVIVNGMVMAEDGKKMSKRLRNYTPPDHLMQEYGADSLRLYLISGNLMKGEEQKFSDAGVREMGRRVLLPWYNAFKFLKTYADIDRWSPAQHSDKSDQILDRWLLSRLQTLKTRIIQEMAAYRLYNVVPALFSFIEELTNWYIRLNRTRFWGAGLLADKVAAYTTLHKVLYELCLIMAPFAPFIAETIYQALIRFGDNQDPNQAQSVHLCSFPKAQSADIDRSLESAVHRMREIILLGRQAREAARVNLRTPVRRLTIVHKNQPLLDELVQLESIFQHELNVKEVTYDNQEDAFVTLYAKPNFPALGKRLGKNMKAFQAAIQELSAEQIETLQDGGEIVVQGMSFDSSEIDIFRKVTPGSNCLTNRHISIVLDCNLDKALIDEGQARELVHFIQKARQASGYQVADRIHLFYAADKTLLPMVQQHLDYICRETLALDAKDHGLQGFDKIFEHEINGRQMRFAVERVV